MKRFVLAMGLAVAMTVCLLAWGKEASGRLAQASPGDVVINEVAWMGTGASSADEWIELLNTTGQTVDLTGWTLAAADGAPNIALSGVISAGGYFLLERTDDTTVNDISADLIYGNDGTAWALNNTGETLELRDGVGALISTANADGGGWPAGNNDTKSSMERIDPAAPDSDTNWATNDGLTRNGLDAGGGAINGTPRAQNSPSEPVDLNVRLYAVHPYALYADDEALALINLDAVTATLTGWGFSDQPGSAKVTLPTAQLAPGSLLWLADDADAFFNAFGFAPDLALTALTHTVPALVGAWPGFANGGDEVLLLDGSGGVVDVLVYGSGLTTTSGWDGAAVPYPRSGFGDGQILYRKLDQAGGRPVPDTDSAADWAQADDDDIDGKKLRYPGWDLELFFLPTVVTETAHLTVWVGPDGLYEGLAGALAAAQSSLWIQGYTFESAELVGIITDRLSAGVAVTLLLEGQPAFGLEDQELWACGQMVDAGAALFFMHNDADAKIFDRYDYQHAKFILIDGHTLLVGSENLSPGGMPADNKSDGTWGHRGVHLATDAPGVVARAQAILERDLDTAHRDVVSWESFGRAAPPDFTPTYTPNWISYTARFSQPLALDGVFAFEVVQSPENSLRDTGALLGLLARAGSGDTVLVEQLYEHVSWGGGANPRLEAYLAAARRGATVRLLLDSRYDDPSLPDSNRATADHVNAIASSEGLDLEARLGNPAGEGIHNKMVLALVGGRGYVHVGSINGSEASHKVNRELALQVQSDAAYELLAGVFDFDWQVSWLSAPGVRHVYLPLAARDYVPPASHLVIGELLYDPVGVDDAQGEWIEIYNPTGFTVTLAGHTLSDGNSYGDGAATFPAGSHIGPGAAVVVAQRADTFRSVYGFAPDFELQAGDASVPDMIPLNGGIGWGNSGDEAILRDATGADVDVVVYGSGGYAGVIPHPGVGWGHSLERKPAHRDTDDCSADFWERYTPAPGQVTLD